MDIAIEPIAFYVLAVACILCMCVIFTMHVRLHAYKEVVTAIVRLAYVMLNMKKVLRYPSVNKKDREEYEKYFTNFMENVDDLERVTDPDRLIGVANRIDGIRYNVTNTSGLNSRLSAHRNMRDDEKEKSLTLRVHLEHLMDAADETLTLELPEAREKYRAAEKMKKLPPDEVDWFAVNNLFKEGIEHVLKLSRRK